MDPIPDSVRRFLLTSIPSVPHLELLMLLWRDRRPYSVEEMASRLYVGPVAARGLAQDLAAADLLVASGDDAYAVRTEPQVLRDLLDEVDRTYARHVRAVAELVHGNLGRRAQDFARAFVWRKP